MKKIVALFFAVAVLSSCGQGVQTPEIPFDAETVSGEALWSYLQSFDYTKWDLLPGHEEMEAGRSPHGAFHSVYISPNMAEAIPVDGSYPDGSILVKENFEGDQSLGAYTVMVKLDGYNPEGGNWFWAKYTADGSVEMEGRADMCLDCHKARSDADYVMLSVVSE